MKIATNRNAPAASLLALFIVAVASVTCSAASRPEELSKEFHRGRLEELYKRCNDGLVLLRGESSWYRKRELRAFDPSYADFNFKQERNLYYLTGIEVPDAFVLIDPHAREVRLYTDWNGERELQDVKKLDYVHGPFPANAFLHDVLLRSSSFAILYSLYEPFPEIATLYGKSGALSGVFPPGMGEPVTEDTQFARRLAELFPSHRVKPVGGILADMQKVKQPDEIRLLRVANEIAARGVVQGIKATRPGVYDHEIAAAIEYEILRQGAVGPTFAMNVMSGPHMFMNLLPLWSDYNHLDRQLQAGEGVFYDTGAEIGYYVSDIGRTAPVSGKFTPEQRAMYDAYLPCFLRSEHAIKPGITQRQLVTICATCALEQASAAKLPSIKRALAQWAAELESHTALGHYQDMNVLGAGAADDEPLQAGMVFAIEPILYSKELNFAVFMEDVILTTPAGNDVLSKGMPYTADEVEALMRRGDR